MRTTARAPSREAAPSARCRAGRTGAPRSGRPGRQRTQAQRDRWVAGAGPNSFGGGRKSLVPADTGGVLDDVEEVAMETRIIGQLRVKGRCHDAPLPHGDRLGSLPIVAPTTCQHFDTLTDA